MTKKGEPFELFAEWYREALELKVDEPTAMALATADGQGKPTVRMVLLKDHGPNGFVFYTNLQSTKGKQIAENPQAALCFYWDGLKKQVRVEGHLTPVTDTEADTYFASRARDSQIGAWASSQSQKMSTSGELAKRIAATALKYGLGTIPRPPHWSGFRLVPDRIEFWQGKKFRLHDRFVFEKDESGKWQRFDLFP